MSGRNQIPVAQQRSQEAPSFIHILLALSLIVFVRRRIGERLLRFRALLLVAVGLHLFAYLSVSEADHYGLRIYVVLMLALGVVHWAHGEWTGRRYGDAALWHSYDRGVSWLMLLPLPFSEGFVHTLLEPVLCGIAGWVISHHLSVWLGYWLMIAATALMGMEVIDNRFKYHSRADLRDAIVESRIQQNVAMDLRDRRAAPPQSETIVRRPG